MSAIRHSLVGHIAFIIDIASMETVDFNHVQKTVVLTRSRIPTNKASRLFFTPTTLLSNQNKVTRDPRFLAATKLSQQRLNRFKAQDLFNASHSFFINIVI
jgi:hypothetical protein